MVGDQRSRAWVLFSGPGDNGWPAARVRIASLFVSASNEREEESGLVVVVSSVLGIGQGCPSVVLMLSRRQSSTRKPFTETGGFPIMTDTWARWSRFLIKYGISSAYGSEVERRRHN